MSCFRHVSNAQGEANIWYFGSDAGLDFNTSPPTPLTNGALSTNEGCASIADKNGALVFYTDGKWVWNKNHIVMPNGDSLTGNSSSVQSAIIVPYPGTYNYWTKRYNKYFIVTIDHVGGLKGVRYSEVDMTLNGGLGDVTATKNIHLFGTNTTEKICVAQHANGCDFWVIGKFVGNADYYVYAITSAGFNNTPVISSVGPIMHAGGIGSLKASPDSKTIAVTHTSTPSIYVYNFDNTTGILSLKFSDSSFASYSYSQEFSPDNTRLYYSQLANANIYQYDLTATSNAAFIASKQIIGTTDNDNLHKIGTMQLAANGKIYVSLRYLDSLGVINNPNVLGTGCGYVDMQQSLGGKIAQLGLPAIVTSLIRPVNKIIVNDSCGKTALQFGLLDTTKIISYNWQFAALSDPNTLLGTSSVYNPQMQFDSTSNYIITAINTYACYTDTIIDTLSLSSPPSISFTTTNISCFGLNDGTITATASGGAGPYTYVWNTADSTSTITDLNAASYKVTITDVNGCQAEDSTVITGPSAPLSITSSNTEHVKCAGDSTGSVSVIPSGGSLPYSYSWNSIPVQNTQQATGLPQGTYTCTVTDSNMCTATEIITITAPSLLTTTVTSLLSLCGGDNGVLSSASTGGTGVYTYNWQPGGATTQTVTVTADTITLYVLTVTDSNNCTAKDSSSITVNPKPVVNFGVSAVCAGDTTFFSDSTSIASGTIATYNWTFGVGTAGSTIQNPAYLYPGCNTYTIGLTATSDSGCTSFNTHPVTVYCPPIASFTVDNICMYEQAAFINTSTGADSYTWDFDYNTGTDDTAASPAHTYSPGIYTIQLIASTAQSCSDTTTRNIEVFNQPLADFLADSVCLNSVSHFTDLSVVLSPDTIISWLWDFDTNSNTDDSTQNPTQLFALAGIHNVQLQVVSNNGCKDTITKNVVVYELPDAQFSAANVCEGNNVQFVDASVSPAGDSIQFWNWNFGDSNTLMSTLPGVPGGYLYALTGSYNVSLQVVSKNGCLDSVSKTIRINPNPVMDFTVSDTLGCEPLCTSFQSLAVIETGNIVQWIWDKGDGSPLNNTEIFEYCYSNGIDFLTGFDIILTVVSDSGCVATLTKNNYITMYPTPSAAFTVQPQTASITDPVISITDLTQGATLWSWNFGDSESSAASTPGPHHYNDTGTYTILLISTNQYNCADTAYKTVYIEPDFLFYIPSAFTPNDDGINDTFTGKGYFINGLEMRIFDRWGSLIFFSDDINKPWNGSVSGSNNLAKGDVYVYSITVTDFKMEKHTYTGIVTLIK